MPNVPSLLDQSFSPLRRLRPGQALGEIRSGEARLAMAECAEVSAQRLRSQLAADWGLTGVKDESDPARLQLLREVIMTVATHRQPQHAPSGDPHRQARQIPPSRRAKAENIPAMTSFGATIDRFASAGVARLTGGLAPTALAEAWFDWALHLASSPGKQLALADKALRKTMRFCDFATRSMADPLTELCIEPLPQDRRFSDPAWRQPPFSLFFQAFQLQQQWCHNATTDVAGVSRHHQDLIAFAARQVLDMTAPSNFVLTNPLALKRTLETGGQNLSEGWRNLWEDWSRIVAGKPAVGTEAFVVGVDVAATSGEVVFRNELMELIQYKPATTEVAAEPLLIVPAWIMKYYILDLTPETSLLRYLVEAGFTVFMISWKNPDVRDAARGVEDYLRLGLAAAVRAIELIIPGQPIHAAGYCLGGTLLAIGAAAMARDGDARLASLTLIAAQVDFTEAGELTLFVDESQVRFLEDVMSVAGVLEARQMAGAFQMLRSNDLIWSRIVRDYLMGERSSVSALHAWNADATRMPARMHGEYLRRLFLENEFAEGRFLVEGRPVSLGDIRVPIFALGAEHDHVAPWRSVYKIHLLTDTEVTFALVSGGHNRGVVSPPGKDSEAYTRIGTTRRDDNFRDSGEWLALAEDVESSWWSRWTGWLKQRTSADAVPARCPSKMFGPAPGTFVMAR